MRPALCLATALLASACNDFASPGELASPQILGIASEPAVLAPGQDATLSILVADETGPLDDLVIEWRLVPPPGQENRGELQASGATATYRAPVDIETDPAGPVFADQLGVAVALDNGEFLLAQKALLVADVPVDNPPLVGIEIDGQLIQDPDVALTTGSEIEIDVRLDPEPDDDADVRVAWYTGIGEIDLERRTPTTIAVERPGIGPIIAVVRQDGGIAWSIVDTRAE